MAQPPGSALACLAGGFDDDDDDDGDLGDGGFDGGWGDIGDVLEAVVEGGEGLEMVEVRAGACASLCYVRMGKRGDARGHFRQQVWAGCRFCWRRTLPPHTAISA